MKYWIKNKIKIRIEGLLNIGKLKQSKIYKKR